MSKIPIFFFLVVVFFSFLFSSVSGWGYEGHRVVAGVAQNLLTEDAKLWVEKLQGEGITLPDIATEPDQYVRYPQGEWSAPLHYANTQFDQYKFDFQSDCGEQIHYMCVVGALFNYTARLDLIVHKQAQIAAAGGDANHFLAQHWTSSSEPFHRVNGTYNGEEPTPLAFITHFVGDVHQPLHVSFACDLGGNEVKTLYDWDSKQHGNYSAALHKIWDTVILQTYQPDWQNMTQQIVDYIDQHPTDIPDATKIMNPDQWADESYDYTQQFVYYFDVGEDEAPDCHHLSTQHAERKNLAIRQRYWDRAQLQKTVDIDRRYPSSNQCPLPDVYFLSKAYYCHNLEIVKWRLEYAGIRLATLLNAIFDQPPPQ
eukprot:CAMPEP_0201562374 /NCGR_PEP_ID=MMETSP0173_2-20130828/79293_1 /ASSEMBLY_ACC=CAM_ASM_000268 /TAXON_ID=218659 /ORGANISM="Vexillifera sp., Strain DIVA3 564/2" /LENGTH=368 /DNA_ID=CAMNT_0047976935 /DNA_START=13 /DNA_END=1119 /DNA_ORIENTATION=-